MRRILLLMISSLFVLSLCACGNATEEIKAPVNFYYLKTEIDFDSANGVLEKEVREGAGFHDNLSAFLHTYLRGPHSSELERLIPLDVYLVSCEANESTVTIVFSAQFSSLSGLKLTTACSALLLSVHDYTGADTIYIQAKDAQIEGKDSIVLSMNDVVLTDIVELTK